MEIYQFNQEDAFRFASEQSIKARQIGDELTFKICPYCKGGAHKDKETFSINLKTGAFNCLRSTCNAHGNMITLHKDFGFSLGRDNDAYYDQSFEKYRRLPQKPIEVRDKAIQYMMSRGISEKVAREYEITARANQDEILVFPFKDENGILQFAKYRNTEYVKGETKGSKEWCEADCKPILFGMNHCNFDNKTLVITEGQMDSLSVAESGIENAVSVPTGAKGFTWVPYCWNFLKKFETLVVFGDCENGEITLLNELSTRFQGTVKAVRQADYQGCKDANELLCKFGKDAVRHAIWGAEATPIPELVDISEVKRRSLSEVPRMLSGIGPLDKLFGGGLFFGQLVVLTGERGEGKSTFASQLAAQAINQNFNVLVYSGELDPWMFRDGFDYQCAGDWYINARNTPYGVTYDINGEVYPDIVKWYTGKLKIYNNEVAKEDEHRALIEIIVDSIKQYGSKVIFVDNLMTAIDDDISSDLYRQQSNFVKKLVQIAQAYEVLIFLIAHPRKAGAGGKFDNDDVSGSSNITNLAGTVLKYGRPKGKDEPQDTSDRLLTVYKNRFTGKTNRDGIRLYYQESSRRISEFDRSFNLNLTWERDYTERSTGKGFISKNDVDMPF